MLIRSTTIIDETAVSFVAESHKYGDNIIIMVS